MLLRRKALTNLDSILKSRDITLTIWVHLVKAVVSSLLIYGYECWAIKLSSEGLMLLNCSVGKDS